VTQLRIYAVEREIDWCSPQSLGNWLRASSLINTFMCSLTHMRLARSFHGWNFCARFHLSHSVAGATGAYFVSCCQKTLRDIFHRSLQWAYHFVYTQAVPNPAVANMAVFIRRREMQPVRRAGAGLSTRKELLTKLFHHWWFNQKSYSDKANRTESYCARSGPNLPKYNQYWPFF